MLKPLLTTTDPQLYPQYLQEKTQRVTQLLIDSLNTPESQQGWEDLKKLTSEVFASIPEGYRMRTEFAIYHQDDEHFLYAMFEPHSKPRKMIYIEHFLGCHQAINEAMNAMRRYLPQWQILKHLLFAMDFLYGDQGNIVITLHYHKKLTDTWYQALQELQQQLNNLEGLGSPESLENPEANTSEGSTLKLTYSFIGRARKQKLVLGNDFVIDTYHTTRGPVSIKHYENTFSQPNSYVCTKMLNFALSCAQDIIASINAAPAPAITSVTDNTATATLDATVFLDAATALDNAAPAANTADTANSNDLLELYCGSGTFTMTLAPLFTKVLATELDRLPMDAGQFNLKQNGITNTKIVRLSAQEVNEAFSGVREFKRLKQQDISCQDYNFSTLLIDPPRAGLHDEAALSFTARYDHVIYISCGPESLAEDLRYLTQTHKIQKIAFFDQFPYTPHLETIVLLSKREA